MQPSQQSPAKIQFTAKIMLAQVEVVSDFSLAYLLFSCVFFLFIITHTHTLIHTHTHTYTHIHTYIHTHTQTNIQTKSLLFGGQ